MAKRINWDSVNRKRRAQRYGSEYAYDELPPVGSYADQARYGSARSEGYSSGRLSGKKSVPAGKKPVSVPSPPIQGLSKGSGPKTGIHFSLPKPGLKYSLKSQQSQTMGSATTKKQQKVKPSPSPEKRMKNLRKSLSELIAVPDMPRWKDRGNEYQKCVLKQISSTLNSLLKQEPLATNEPNVVKARNLLKQYRF